MAKRSKKTKAAKATTKKTPRIKAGIVIKKAERANTVGKAGDFAHRHASYNVIKDGRSVGVITTKPMSQKDSEVVEVLWVVKKGGKIIKTFPRQGREGGFKSAKAFAVKKFA